MADTLLGAMTLVATLHEEEQARAVNIEVEVRLDPKLQEMLRSLSDAEKVELAELRRQVARAATDFFSFVRDPDTAATAID